MKTRGQTHASLPVTMDMMDEGRESGGSESAMENEDDRTSLRSASPASPPRRRRRPAKVKKNIKQGTSLRRAHGKLAGVLALPVEVFTEFFQSLLMQRSAAHIWRTALQNLPDLPPCPNDLNEPQYAALLFTKYCSLCGESTMRSVDPYLNVRLCNACRDEQLVDVGDIKPESLAQLIHQSPISQIKIGQHLVDTCLRAEKEEIEGIWQDVCAGDAKSDKSTIEWVKETARACTKRIRHAKALVKYLSNLADGRSQELEQLKDQRRQEVKRRLEESGWEEPDWLFSEDLARKWIKLVEAPKPLTDRVWQKLYPQLVPFLKKNRGLHIKESKAKRRAQRKRRLHKLLIGIKNQSALLSVDRHIITGTSSDFHPAATPPDEDELVDIPENDDHGPSATNTPKFLLRAPFPCIADALKFPIISPLVGEDIDADTMENLFEESRAEIQQAILDWCSLTEEHLVRSLELGTLDPNESSDQNHGSESGSENGNFKCSPSELELQFEIPTGCNFPDGLRPNTQLLLRADSVFRVADDKPCPPPLYYPELFSIFQDKTSGYFTPKKRSRWPFRGRPKLGYPWSLDDVIAYPEGVLAAKALLSQLERPDAAQFELQALGARFSCGPCGGKWLMTWNEIVQHYAEAQVHELKAEQTDTSTVYLTSHSLDLNIKRKGKGKPLVVLHSPQECQSITSAVPRTQKLMQCNLCQEFNIQFRAPRDAMLKHVRAVHAINPPKSVHYSRTSDSQMHIRIQDPDTGAYESGSDGTGFTPEEMEDYLMRVGAAARWTNWTDRRLCDMDWGSEVQDEFSSDLDSMDLSE